MLKSIEKSRALILDTINKNVILILIFLLGQNVFIILKIYGLLFYTWHMIDFLISLQFQRKIHLIHYVPIQEALVAQKGTASQVPPLGQEDPLEKEMVTYSGTLSWKTPWKEKPGRLQSMGLQRVGHDQVTSLSLYSRTLNYILADMFFFFFFFQLFK